MRSVPNFLSSLGCFLLHFRGGGGIAGYLRVFLDILRRVMRDLDSEFLRFISFFCYNLNNVKHTI